MLTKVKYQKSYILEMEYRKLLYRTADIIMIVHCGCVIARRVYRFQIRSLVNAFRIVLYLRNRRGKIMRLT